MVGRTSINLTFLVNSPFPDESSTLLLIHWSLSTWVPQIGIFSPFCFQVNHHTFPISTGDSGHRCHIFGYLKVKKATEPSAPSRGTGQYTRCNSPGERLLSPWNGTDMDRLYSNYLHLMAYRRNIRRIRVSNKSTLFPFTINKHVSSKKTLGDTWFDKFSIGSALGAARVFNIKGDRIMSWLSIAGASSAQRVTENLGTEQRSKDQQSPKMELLETSKLNICTSRLLAWMRKQ